MVFQDSLGIPSPPAASSLAFSLISVSVSLSWGLSFYFKMYTPLEPDRLYSHSRGTKSTAKQHILEGGEKEKQGWRRGGHETSSGQERQENQLLEPCAGSDDRPQPLGEMKANLPPGE